jgi:hypothetical protein
MLTKPLPGLANISLCQRGDPFETPRPNGRRDAPRPPAWCAKYYPRDARPDALEGSSDGTTENHR